MKKKSKKINTEFNYHIGTDWVDGKCINLYHSFQKLKYAKQSAIIARNTFKRTYHVFDNDGNIKFSIKYDDNNHIISYI